MAAHTQRLPVLAEEVSLDILRPPTGLLSRAWAWIQARRVERSSTRRLRVAETVSLGEKRFVAVVQVDGRHFLLAGGPTNIALLAQLDAKEDFEDVLKKTMTVPGKQPAKAKQAAKRISKQHAFAGAPVNTHLMAPLNGIETFDDVLQKTMTKAGKPPVKQPSKVNSRSTIEQTGHYA